MSVVDEVFFMVLGILDAGFELIMPVVLATFALAFGWAVTRLAFAWLAGAMDNIIGDLIGMFVIFWLFLAIAWSAKEIVDAAGNFALALGGGIVGADGATADLFTPSALWGIGDGQADKILATKQALCSGWIECGKTLDDRLMLELAALFIYVAFAFLVFEMATTAIGYKTNGLFMLLFTPMAVTPFTKNMAEGAIQGWLNNLVKLVIIAMVAGIGSRAFELMDLPPTPVFDDIIPAVLLAVFIAWLAWQSRTLSAGIISAVPQLSSQAITRGIGNVARSVTGTGAMVERGRSLAQREVTHMTSTWRGIGQGAQRVASGARTTASAAAQSQYWSRVAKAAAGQSRRV
ncbi:type IV secretion system protein (plasmid) [Skermanella sp. TT6]|uniref:Type IV secretion system protein n=1 Tax=Skermanella cutis TaxID=2775420 RepID=A0ABX7BHC8_9PROT|nr:type IV secretion system protein [Skermanella sp. TT6]QQP93806.1 type IV secretion system protein [Skermanella sp. TT6]